jgi:hypothetical protein
LIYIGYFVPIKISFHLIRLHFEQTSSLGLLRLIAPLLTGAESEELIQSEKILDQLLSIILKSEYTDNFQVNILDRKMMRYGLFFSYQFKMNFYVFVDF